MSQMLKSSGAMSAATMLSRVLGMGREMAYAAFMGSSWVADAFQLAFMVPNLFRRLLGEGALTAAFIPIFKEKEKTEGEVAMWRAANAVVSGLTVGAIGLVAVGLVIVSALLALRMPEAQALRLAGSLVGIVPWLAGVCIVVLAGYAALRTAGGELGRWRDRVLTMTAAGCGLFLVVAFGVVTTALKDVGGPKTILMLELMRVMLPYLVLVCLAAIFMGMLNARGHFFVPAMGATLLNVVVIASVIVVMYVPPFRSWPMERQIFGLAIGVVAAGFAQAAFQFPLLRREGFDYGWIPPWRDATVARVVRQMIPGTIGVAAFQINVMITQGMAFAVEEGVVSSFNYAVRLMELPQGVFGISLGTYLLPTLSGLAADRKYPEFRRTLAHGVGWLVYVNLLASILLLILAEPMIRLLFERGKFDPASTLRSAGALACLAPGLVAFSVVNILARAFYALGDTATPMRISVFCLVLNILISAALVVPFREAGLGAANTATSLINVSLLLYALRRKLKTLGMQELRRALPAMAGAAVAAGGVAWAAVHWWTLTLGHRTLLAKLGEVFVPMTAASLVYLALNFQLKTGYGEELLKLLRIRVGTGAGRGPDLD